MRRAKAAVEVAEAAKALAAAVNEEEVADAKRYQRTAAAWVVAADEADEEAASMQRRYCIMVYQARSTLLSGLQPEQRRIGNN